MKLLTTVHTTKIDLTRAQRRRKSLFRSNFLSHYASSSRKVSLAALTCISAQAGEWDLSYDWLLARNKWAVGKANDSSNFYNRQSEGNPRLGEVYQGSSISISIMSAKISLTQYPHHTNPSLLLESWDGLSLAWWLVRSPLLQWAALPPEPSSAL